MASASVLLAACGREDIPGSALPAQVSGFRSASVTAIDAERLAAEAVDPEELGSVLDAAGFTSAVERSYTSTLPAIRRVDAILARFESDAGATRYLDWLGDHASELIGRAELATEHRLDGVPIYIHLPDGCCPKEQVVALAAWRDGPYVARAVVAGPDADGAAAVELIAALRDGIAVDA
ncbi:MAG TPA: hypothetical protein VFZ96_04355 [Actinomycetota bacterium]|nr:hypothetical protein [Actinomycetota bacterium]